MAQEELILQRLADISKENKEIKDYLSQQSMRIDSILLSFTTHKAEQTNKHLECRDKFDIRYVQIQNIDKCLEEFLRSKRNGAYKVWTMVKDIVTILNMLGILYIAQRVIL